MFRIPVDCNYYGCPVFDKCCQLPTMCFPVNDVIDVLFVGQGGGSEERKKGTPFVGPAGQRLRDIVLHINNDIPMGVAFSNTIRDNPEGNRVPTEEELEKCLPHLNRDTKTLMEGYNLKVIVSLGNASKKAIVGSTQSMAADRNKVWVLNYDPLLISVATYHPSYLIRQAPKLDPESKYDKAVIEDILVALREYVDRRKV